MKAVATATALSLGDLGGNPSPHLKSPICKASADPETQVPSPALSLHGSAKTKTNFIFSIPSFFHQPSEQAKFRPKISRERLSHPVYQRFMSPINISEERLASSLPPVLDIYESEPHQAEHHSPCITAFFMLQSLTSGLHYFCHIRIPSLLFT